MQSYKTLTVSNRKACNDDNMIPLINIVFLLLIFYMIAGQIHQQQAENIELPTSSSNTEVKPAEVRIQINRKKQIYLDDITVSIEQLDKKLAQKNNLKQLYIALHVDKKIDAAELSKTLEVLRKHKIEKIRLFTEQQIGNSTS